MINSWLLPWAWLDKLKFQCKYKCSDWLKTLANQNALMKKGNFIMEILFTGSVPSGLIIKPNPNQHFEDI